MKGRLRDWGPATLWAAALFFLSSRSTLPVGLGGGWDKVAHFTAYALLGLLLARGQMRESLSPWWAVLAGALFAASDEFLVQAWSGRTVEFGDWITDVLGVLCGVFLRNRVVGRFERKRDD
ncbi:MAG: VanZ family protein [Longimicrobiaceae bacterium]